MHILSLIIYPHVVPSAWIRIVRIFDKLITALLMNENIVHTLRPSDAFQNGATLTQRDSGNELLNKCRYFYFLCIQKYSCRFIKFRLNH